MTPLSACTGAETTACDDAIKATLKAPSTYKRLKSGERRTETMSRRIDYEAVNSFNAPIRGSGECVFNSGHAYWYEDRT
ncbi:MAG: hypothetical protein EOP60_07180 [Sphingomonadales bacterium]|nr:MAG: hypothetical protein EOP60_07180 [Sphingomonadales bacterium]